MENNHDGLPRDYQDESPREAPDTLGIDRAEVEARKKKAFIALPFIVTPCLIFAFWMVRGGGGQEAAGETEVVHNVNTDLPEPILDQPRSKRDAYELSDREAKVREFNLLHDPYAEQLADEGGGELPSTENKFSNALAERTSKLSNKLGTFNDRLADVEQNDVALSSSTYDRRSSTGPVSKGDTPRLADSRISSMTLEEDKKIEALEAKMAQLNQYGSSSSGTPPAPFPDPFQDEPISSEDSLAAAQLQTLDKIMERATMLRYPELAEEELRKQSLANGQTAYPITQASASDREVRYFGAPTVTTADSLPQRRGGFYTDEERVDHFKQITVGAQVHSSMTVVDGSTVKLRLLDDVFVAGLRIPKHSFVYATTSLRGDRLRIEVETINFRGNIYQVNLEGYDLDGLPGIAVPGSIERQVAKREAAQSARSLGGTTRGNNLAGQLAVEGTEAVKDIASRKLAVIKVHLKAAHQIILRNKG